ncbi:MAG: hypothetical protein RH946_07295 [Rhodospirillales bacterium]
MAVSIGGTVTINIKDLNMLPSSDADCEAFCLQVIGPECWQQIDSIRGLSSTGVAGATRAGPADPDLAVKGISVGLTITGSF